MKKLTNILLPILFLVFSSCEEVIDVSLETIPPRLVVEASINWIKGTTGSTQSIRISTTTGYFNTQIPAVTNAVVRITSNSGTVFTFVQQNQPGLYVCSTFSPVVNETYTLSIDHEGAQYTATETLLATPSINRIEQRSNAGITGDAIEVKFFFNDIRDETNFYLFSVQSPYKAIPDYAALQDRFFQNNEMFGLYRSSEFKPNDTVAVTLSGISKQYYNYMTILLAQAGTSSSGPFSTPNATVRGNIVNQTNFNNFALGYFRLGEMEVKDYRIR